MLTRSGNVYVIKTQFHLQRPFCQPGKNALRLEAAMAEWLRRLTRNQMGSSRVGSNPARSVKF